MRIKVIAFDADDTLWQNETLYAQAQDVLTLAVPLFQKGKTVSAESAEPVYLRNKVAKSIAERQAEQQ